MSSGEWSKLDTILRRLAAGFAKSNHGHGALDAGRCRYFTKVVNPKNGIMSPKEEQFLRSEVATFKTREGLLRNDQRLYIGYIARGHCAEFARQLSHDLRAMRETDLAERRRLKQKKSPANQAPVSDDEL